MSAVWELVVDTEDKMVDEYVVGGGWIAMNEFLFCAPIVKG